MLLFYVERRVVKSEVKELVEEVVLLELDVYFCWDDTDAFHFVDEVERLLADLGDEHVVVH